MTESVKVASFLLLLSSLLFILKISTAIDTISTTQILRDGDTLVSSGGRFELGFFSPDNTNNRYVGIWYTNITVFKAVWVANGETPVISTSGILKVLETGVLVLQNDTNNIVWSSNRSRLAKNPVLQLLDVGNLVLREANDDRPENFIWQSSDHLTDTFLPDINFGWNSATGILHFLSSWTNNNDPTPGDYTIHLDPTGYPQSLIKKGDVILCRMGPWNGLHLSGLPNSRQDPTYTNVFITDENKTLNRIEAIDRSVISRYTLSPNGVAQRWIWVHRIQDWVVYQNVPSDYCDTYKLCGTYGSCKIENSPVCGCLDRFVPKDPEGWVRSEWSNGCIRRTPLNCEKGSQNKGFELPLFELSTVSKATNNFSTNNKLGQGGYGPVYKGVLRNGHEIAVKRLSKTSMQGIDELKNEVICISKLQHRNLVKLIGWCIQGEENMLIYEYMPNKSLDLFLFDETRSILLDWPTRLQVVNGVARGHTYIHQDSQLRIIHRDLKASNILLDTDMKPKISDFGIAKSFQDNETENKTSKVVGTYGYMSPEYAVHGRFSVKSDVFSFGVLVLEIVSGQRNSGFSHEDQHLNLLGHAWTLYKEGRSVELVDPFLRDSASPSEVLRLIHVGLLCMQQCPVDRPSMASVVAMLENEVIMPPANQPGFFVDRDVIVAKSKTSSSSNKATITKLEAR